MYCSSIYTGPESFDSPIDFVLQKKNAHAQAFPIIKEK